MNNANVTYVLVTGQIIAAVIAAGGVVTAALIARVTIKSYQLQKTC